MNANPVRRRRVSAAVLALLTGLASTGCDSLLDATNPEFINEDQLTNPALEQLVVNGVVGEFQYAYGYYALYSSAMTDESFLDHTEVNIRELTLRNIRDANTVDAAIYANLHRARQSAEDGVARLKEMLGDANAAKSTNMALIQALGGYAYTLLGEGFCESTVNLSAPMRSDEILQRGITLFDQAIATAQAAGSSATATDILNMARVGAARAALKLGDGAKARGYASQVPANYEKWAWYSANSVRENNIFNVPAGVSGAWQSMGPYFQGLNDPRAPKTTSTTIRGLNSNPIFPAQRPYMYSGWSASTPDNRILIDTDIKFATGLEARYVVAEVDGPTAATLAFVNERRAVGGKPAVSLTGNDLMAELRVNRALDFYLTGQRLGDLRRYKAKLGVDMFPTGKFPVSNEVYSDATCFVVPLTEKNSNPNYGG
ncbi:MAG: hypothetical protein AMXMBFR53_25840 [Gemmatimonadota bacterium]